MLTQARPLAVKTGDEIVVSTLNKSQVTREKNKGQDMYAPTAVDPLRPMQVRAVPSVSPPPAKAAPVPLARPVSSPPKESRVATLFWATGAIAAGIALGLGATWLLSHRAPHPRAAAAAEARVVPAPAPTIMIPAKAEQSGSVFGEQRVIRPADVKATETKAAEPVPQPAAAEPKAEVKLDPKPAAPEPKPARVVAAPEPKPEPKAAVATTQPKPEPKPARAARAETSEPKTSAKAEPARVQGGKSGHDVEAAAKDAELLRKQLEQAIP